MQLQNRDTYHKTPRALLLALLVSLLSLFSQISQVQAQPVTVPNTEIIINAFVTFDGQNGVVTASAATSFFTATESPSILEFMQIAASDSNPADTEVLTFPGSSCSPSGSNNGPFIPTNLNDLSGQPIVNGTNLNLISGAGAFISGDVLFVSVIDFDQNLDANVAETISIEITNGSGDREIVQAFETDLSSAEFVAAIQTQNGPNNVGNCVLDVSRGNTLTATYADESNGGDTVSSVTLIDPFGVAFDSQTGEPLDGITISLFSEDTGALAEVFSPNGIDRWPSTVVTGEDVTDSSGTIFTITPGEYRFPRVAAGDYSFVITTPAGFTFPSTRPFNELQNLPGAPYVLSDASLGAVFAVPPGPNVQVDIPFDPIQGEVVVEKSASASVASIGDFLQYQIQVQNNEFDLLADLVIEDTLPEGFRLQPESLRVNDQEVAPEDLEVSAGSFEVGIGDLQNGQSANISYVVEITSGAPEGEAINRATSISQLATSNVAESSILVTNELFGQTSFMIGRVYEGSCNSDDSTDVTGIAGARIYFEDGLSITTDSNGRWHLDGIEPGVHVLRLDESSLGDNYEIVACDVNSRNFQSPNNSFVDLAPGALWRHDFVVRKTSEAISGDSALERFILEREFNDVDTMPAYDQSWLGSDSFEVLWPEAGYTPRLRSISAAVKHSNSETVELILNGEVVSPLNRRESVSSAIFPRRISTWRGIDIQDGLNELVIRRLNAQDEEVSRETREIYYAGAPYRAELAPEYSHLKADGRTPILVAVQLTDSQGYPVRAATSGEFRVSEPFEGWLPENQRLESNLIGVADNRPLYVVREDGIAYFPIEATTQTGRIALEVPLSDNRSEIIEAWVSADTRDWIMVGLAEGTYGRTEIENNLQPLSDDDEEFYDEGRIAFFGKGRIPGDFLVTIAYDSAKETSDNPGELFNDLDPDEFYTVYGDESQRINEAESSEKLYLKIERSQFYALFGDFQTNLNITELSNYSRSLVGFKSEFKNEYFETNLFATETALSNIREEIPGNGTAGRYFLSRGEIVDFSENIVIQVRDRFQTGQILSETPLTRNRDYDIDYDLGTVLFNNPILTRDPLQNPIFIVINYETQDDREAALVAGGRIEVSTADDRIELGLSHINEQNRGAEAELTGLDLTYQATQDFEIQAEVAVSDNVAVGSADAWSVSGDFENGIITTRAFARQIDGGFGVGQQNTSDIGTRTYGVSSDLELGSNYSIRVTADNQQLLDTDSENTQASIEARRIGEKTAIQLGYRWAEEDNPTTGTTDSQLVSLGASYQLSSDIRLDASSEFSLDNQDDSTIFPTRNRVGAEWQINSSSSIFVNQERTSGGTDTRANQIGLRTSMWNGSEINIGVDQSEASGVDQISAVAGVTQRAQLTDNLSVDFSFDSGRDLSDTNPTTGINADTPPTSGTGGNDFNTGSIGWDWRKDNWSWNNQIEYRNADSGDSTSVRTGLLRRLESGKSFLGSIEWFAADSDTTDNEDVTFSLSYADRSSQNYALLNRLDLAYSEDTISGQTIREEKIISNNNLNLTKWENSHLSLIYSAKYVLTTIDDTEFSGYTDLIGAQYRHDLSERWDIGLQASTLRSQNSDTNRYSYGASIGYSPIRDTWLEVGYNFDGFSDDDFDASEWTEEGVYFSIRYKFDETSLARIAAAASVFDRKPSVSPKAQPLQTPVEVLSEDTSTDRLKSVTAQAQANTASIPTPPLASELSTDILPEHSETSCDVDDIIRLIQLASFPELSVARSFLNALSLENSFIEEYQSTNATTFYRVIVGPYTETKTELANAVESFYEQTGIEPWVKDQACSDLQKIG